MKKSFLYVGMLAVALSMSMTSCHDSDGGNEPKAEVNLGESYVISGTVKDANGNSLTGVSVEGLDGVTTVNGTFTANTTKGTKNLVFTKNGYGKYQVSVELAEATTDNPLVTAVVNAVLPKVEVVTVSATEDYSANATVAESNTTVVLPATGTEQADVEVAIYTPAPAEVVSAPEAVSTPATVSNASPLALSVVNYEVTEGKPAVLTVPVAGATASSDYVLLSCVNDANGQTTNVSFANGAYVAEFSHFSTWTFNLGKLTKTVAVGKEGTTVSASVTNNSGSTATKTLAVKETVGYTLTMSSSLPAGMQSLIKAAIRSIEGVEGTSTVTRNIPVSVSGNTKVDYTFANTMATVTYNVGLNNNKNQVVTVTRYTGLKKKSENASIIGHSGGSGN